MPEFLHARRDFGPLPSLVVDERRVDPVLVEKDYWLMHCLWGLQAQGLRFELKGGRVSASSTGSRRTSTSASSPRPRPK
jgi:hypothetical protein